MGAKKGGGEGAGKVVDPASELNRRMQELYREGRLGSNPYVVDVDEVKRGQVEGREGEKVRKKRAMQHVNAVLPVMTVDRGEEMEEGEEADGAGEEEEGREMRKGRRGRREEEVDRLVRGMGVGSMQRSEPWYLYPPPCTVAGETPLTAMTTSRSIDGGQIQRVR